MSQITISETSHKQQPILYKPHIKEWSQSLIGGSTILIKNMLLYLYHCTLHVITLPTTPVQQYHPDHVLGCVPL